MTTSKGVSRPTQKKRCTHSWQYSGPIDGHDDKDDIVIVRRCWSCGYRQMAYAAKWRKARGDYALDDHYEGFIRMENGQ